MKENKKCTSFNSMNATASFDILHTVLRLSNNKKQDASKVAMQYHCHVYISYNILSPVPGNDTPSSMECFSLNMNSFSDSL